MIEPEREKDGPTSVTDPGLSEFSAIGHGFFTRAGGVSPPPFDSLNFSPRDGDTETNVATNRRIAAASFGLDPSKLVTVTQVHGTDVYVPEDGPAASGDAAIEADAIVTGLTGIMIGVLTADCLPVLLYDPVKQVIGAVHAGRRGTLEGVSGKAAGLMQSRFGSAPKDIRAALGPHIRTCCYTVGPEVAEEFTSRYGRDVGCISGSGNTLRLDIGEANTAHLLKAGLSKENIGTSSSCTSCEHERFFSYRKDGGVTGRQLSFIAMKHSPNPI